MGISNEKFIAARRASGMSIEKAATLANVSKPCYVNREKHPEQFRLCEISAVYKGMTDTAKPIMHDAVQEIFLSD